MTVRVRDTDAPSSHDLCILCAGLIIFYICGDQGDVQPETISTNKNTLFTPKIIVLYITDVPQQPLANVKTIKIIATEDSLWT